MPASRRLLAPLDRALPPGLYDAGGFERLGDAWPEQPLWLVTIDRATRRRVVLRRIEDARRAPLHRCVAASCAVPGVFVPQRIGGRTLLDGGVHSTTNLDLAARAPSRIVIALAPLAYDPGFPIVRARAAMRGALNAQLLRERRAVARAGGRTLLLRPSGDDLAVRRGGHLFSTGSMPVIAERAYETTREILRRPSARALLQDALELLADTATA